MIDFSMHRKNAAEAMPDRSLILSYSGRPVHSNEDDYYGFEVNSQFFWLTGLQREGQILLISKFDGEIKEYLFIEEADDFTERWTGKMPKKKDVAEISGIPEASVLYTDALSRILNRLVCDRAAENLYMDVYREDPEDAPDYNAVMAERMQSLYPNLRLMALRTLAAPFRMRKDAGEVEAMRKAISVTGKGLEAVMQHLKPGLYEYQLQAVFEGTCAYHGCRKTAFPTIAGSGIHACSMHYGTNDDVIGDGSLVLFDLGAKYGNYCSDITRTYPANGRFTERQKQIYSLVLKANKAVKKAARPGLTLRELNDVAKKVLGEGLVALGLIQDVSEVGKYYMHSVTHSLGIDAHDTVVGNGKMEEGWVITDEPGLYIDEEGIGIRIEDDLLITADGCVCLSDGIIEEIDEIEAFMNR